MWWQETRLREGIVKLQPQEEPLRSELLSGKFTILVSTEATSACLSEYAVSTLRQHADPSEVKVADL